MNIVLPTLLVILRLHGLKVNMFNVDVQAVVIVQLPVIAVLLHEECVKIVGAIISVWHKVQL